jgi:polyferredoxin
MAPAEPLLFYRVDRETSTAAPCVAGSRAAPALRRQTGLERRERDGSQPLRLAFQLAFVLLNLWIGARFYLFVRHFETGGQTLRVPRPPGVEGWLPIAGLMNLKYTLLTGDIPAVHPAALVLLVAFLAISLVARKAFCGWLCPVGTLSEWLWQGGEALFGRTFAPPRWLDVALRSLKYVLLGLFAYAVASMPVEALRAFVESPYGLIADVKMLNFFRFLGTTAAIVIGVLLLISVIVKNAWCRYLCPYGALVGLAALASPVRIRREPDACIDCAKCARACPSRLPVDRLTAVRSAECTACLLCVDVCPAKGALALTATGRRVVPAWALAATIAIVFVGLVASARLTGHWHTPVPDSVYFELVPRANQFAHP